MTNQITGHTKLICLLGSPVEHSISPAMHNESFQYHHLDYAYLAFDVKEAQLSQTVETLKSIGARGWNLTMPDKQKMCELCDHLSPAAEISGAVNTVVNDHGVLTGHTTDGIGYLQACKDAGYPVIGKKMTLLGAGGAGTAILVQAALDGVKEIAVFKRTGRGFEETQERARKLCAQTDCKVSVYDYADTERMKYEIADSQILTNSTNLGMAPDTEGCPLSDLSCLHSDLIVSDVIYNPKQTRLLQLAKKAGCPTFNGLYMLLYQGAAAFSLWTGKEMPVERIKEKYFTRG